MLTPRHAVTLAAGAIMALGASAVSGQNYPTKSIRFYSTEAGGILDLAARTIAQDIAGSLGQPVVIENIPSALSGETLSRAAPDGYNIALGAGTIWLTPLIQKTSYDPLKDLVPITLVETYPHVLVVHASVPAKSVKELIALAKARPGVLNIGAAASPGGQSFLSAELFKAMAHIDMVRVPYKGNQAALIALLGGEIHLMFNDVVSVAPYVKLGRLRALAVTSLQPFPPAPELPTLSASGLPGYESILIAGVMAPAGTPPAIINRLSQEMMRTLRKPEIRAKFANADVVGSTPEQFGATIRSEITKWGKVLRDAGVKPEI